jgi:cellulose synthase/poly-beta-1,6-N-acetylglucosamine synthase-like glycosyltransferase
MAWQITFWISAGLVAYAYAAYPVLIWCLSRVFGRAVQPPHVKEEELPGVALLIAAHNEEAVISDRIENALRTDYPRDRFRIVVASDGSADETATIVRRYADRGVVLLDYKARRGKASVLNAAVATLDSELVLLSDANTHMNPDAARKIARWFANPAVGAVCGRLTLTDSATGANADGVYWKYETFLKKCEGRLGALLGSNGAIYAIRRDVYIPIPDGTIVDDFVIPLLAKQRTGCGIVYECAAVAHEETAPNIRSEFQRRVRIGAGGFQAIALLWRLLDPRQGWVAFTFFSHKILRWLCPLGLIGAFLSGLALWEHPFYAVALAAQLAFFAAAAVATWLPNLRLARALRVPAMFASMNVALLLGLWRWVLGNQTGTWKRTARSVELTPGTLGREMLEKSAGGEQRAVVGVFVGQD